MLGKFIFIKFAIINKKKKKKKKKKKLINK